jgi:hypothetical protein
MMDSPTLSPASATGSAALVLTFPPDWDAIQRAWEPCRAYLTARGLDDDSAYALCMVVQELLENAVKYGDFGDGDARIHLELSGTRDGVTIEVHSPLDDEPTGLDRLDSMIQWIRGFQSPFEAYVERLKEVAGRPFDHGESGLGLVRMAYEGQCILDFYTGDSNVLAMSAVYQPNLRGAHGAA